MANLFSFFCAFSWPILVLKSASNFSLCLCPFVSLCLFVAKQHPPNPFIPSKNSLFPPRFGYADIVCNNDCSGCGDLDIIIRKNLWFKRNESQFLLDLIHWFYYNKEKSGGNGITHIYLHVFLLVDTRRAWLVSSIAQQLWTQESFLRRTGMKWQKVCLYSF